MFLLIVILPIVTALIGFSSFVNPQNPQIAGVISNIEILSPTPIKEKIEPSEDFSNLINIQEETNNNSNDNQVVEDEAIEEPKSSPKEDISSNSSGDLLSQINNFRSDKGLAPLIASSETCFFANIRVQEISTSFNHDGFNNRVGSNSLPYPSYSEVVENIAINPDPNAVVSGWINSPGHNDNMSKSVPYGCVVDSGHYYVFEAWRP